LGEDVAQVVALGFPPSGESCCVLGVGRREPVKVADDGLFFDDEILEQPKVLVSKERDLKEEREPNDVSTSASGR
jgi:hypothetical protein